MNTTPNISYGISYDLSCPEAAAWAQAVQARSEAGILIPLFSDEAILDPTSDPLIGGIVEDLHPEDRAAYYALPTIAERRAFLCTLPERIAARIANENAPA